jgi:hypothetical protein
LAGDWAEEATEGNGYEDDASSPSSGEQADIDQQLRDESQIPGKTSPEPSNNPLHWRFPNHLDSEWLALEVYAEDDDEIDSNEGDLGEEDSDPGEDKQLTFAKARSARDRSSVDSKLLDQIRNISVRSTPVTESRSLPPHSSSDQDQVHLNSVESFVSRSPFGAITSSLSLMEMLMRLASLQEFQQASHLAIPDHILTFFLEETSSTGLRGEERWKARNEAKRRVGFDPYTDTPTKIEKN